MQKMLPSAVLVLALGYVTAAYSAGDPAAGAQKNGMCQGCHGLPGYRHVYPDYRVPRLGGQHAQYIVNALQEYKTKARSNTTMQAIAATLSDQDMQDLAAYYSAKPAQPTTAAPVGGTKP